MRARFARLLLTAAGLCTAACSGEPPRAARAAARVVVLGLDGMDHGLTSAMLARGELPHLARLARSGGFAALQTSTPPQSPTAWSNFITGMRPGHHGIFDFVQRDPATLEPHLSMSEVREPSRLAIGSLAIPIGAGEAVLLRRQRPFWWYLSEAGVPATVIRIPSHFPPRDDGDARVLAGMGTPDLLGTYGTFSVLTNDRALVGRELSGGRVVPLRESGGVLEGRLEGPADPFSSRGTPLAVRVTVAVDAAGQGALVTIGDRRTLLAQGEWSDFVPVALPMLGGLDALPGIVRLYLKRTAPEVVLYVSPLNIDPLDPALPISSPPELAAQLASRGGRFYTQGMPEDTKALAAGILSPDELLQQARLVLERRRRMLWDQLEDSPTGLLFFYFSSSDQLAHVFFRAHDPEHPARTAADDPHAEVIRDVYRELDAVVGETRRRLAADDLLIVMSDHGFGPAGTLFDLNAWLLSRGYLALRQSPGPGALGHIDWSKTQAYGLGLNGLYVNLQGRERDGVVPAARRNQLLRQLARELKAVLHPLTGERVVTQVARPDRLYPGPALERAPDLVVGYGRGFKVADASALGRPGPDLFAVNRAAWSGDHCGDSRLVPGIIASSRPLRPGPLHLHDLPPTILTHLGVATPQGFVGRSVLGAPSGEHDGKGEDR